MSIFMENYPNLYSLKENELIEGYILISDIVKMDSKKTS